MPKTDQRSRKGFRPSDREIQFRAIWACVKECHNFHFKAGRDPEILERKCEGQRKFLEAEIRSDRQARVIFGEAGVPIAPKAVLK